MNNQNQLIFALVISAIAFFSNSAIAGGTDIESCPSKTFSNFLAAYTESPAVQREFTHNPLKKMITVDAEPEPEQKVVLVEMQDISFPLIPDASRRASEGIQIEILEETKKNAKVKIEKPDTDYQVLYIFKLEHCWILEEVQDYSL